MAAIAVPAGACFGSPLGFGGCGFGSPLGFGGCGFGSPFATGVGTNFASNFQSSTSFSTFGTAGVAAVPFGGCGFGSPFGFGGCGSGFGGCGSGFGGCGFGSPFGFC